MTERGGGSRPNDAAALGDLFADYGKSVAPDRKERPKRSEAQEAAIAEVREEKSELAKLYRHYKKEHKAAMLERGGRELESIVSWLATIGPDDGTAVIETFRQYCDQCQDVELRQFLLSEVNRVSMKLREKAGLDELSDPLPWDSNGDHAPGGSVFLHCREMLDE